jgi:NAD(P)-dependent dehydrogenase (short-subunit alcohol dehydrogenase family)
VEPAFDEPVFLEGVDQSCDAPLRDAERVGELGHGLGAAAVERVQQPHPLAHYDAAKAALNRYTLGLAQELSPDRIRVNIVTPGPVLTPGGDAVREPFIQAMGATPEAVFAQVPLGGAGAK